MSFAQKVNALHWPDSRFGGPYIIGHRGAQHHATENTLHSFEIASKFGADMWELDIRCTADGHCVVCHDDDLSRIFGVEGCISNWTAAELHNHPDVFVPSFQAVVHLAKKLGTGLYIEIKGEGAGPKALQVLSEEAYSFAALGSFHPDFVAELADLECPYPLSILVRVGDNPFDMATLAKADAIHLCWERASDRPDALLTEDLMQTAKDCDLPVILWHEERLDVIKAVMDMDVAGVCTDRPELLVPYANAPSRAADYPKGAEVVCHRGINKLAPENTLEAAKLAFEQGFDWLELDVHETADGELVVIHDATLERTTNGEGQVADKTLAELKQLDAGGWLMPRLSSCTLPSLEEMIDLAQIWEKKIYIEIKHASPQKVLDLVEKKNFLDDCFFWSFDWPQIAELKKRQPNAQVMARISDYETLDALLEDAKPFVVEIGPGEEAPNLIKAIRAYGAKAMVCYMGDDPAIFERIFALAPDMVNLDNPQLWKQVWNQKGLLADEPLSNGKPVNR